MLMSRPIRRRTVRPLAAVWLAASLLASGALPFSVNSAGTRVQALAPSSACGTELRLLVISADGSEVALSAIRSTLNFLGTPYTLYVATQNPNGLTANRLEQGCRALYNGVILTTAS